MALSTADAAHLLRRSGFGVTPAALAELTALSSRTAAVNKVLDLRKNPVATPPVPTTQTPDNYTAWKTMTSWWMDRMRTSPTPIVEKMTLFWHGHFTSSLDKVGDMGVMVEQHMTLRQHALGNFQSMAQAMSINPGMLKYLDNWANSAGKVQENFARELMELFTLGVGNYTQDDVVSMARAWTGHGVDASYRNYQFNPAKHDNGMKRLFGGTARNWDGPAALTEILKGSKAVASSKFIAAKVFSYLAYPVTPNDPIVTPLATTFRSSGLNILTLVKAVFNSTAFWSTTARRALVRTPIAWFVATLQATGLPASNIPVATLVQAGQVPFSPPDVSGWGQNEDWLSTSEQWGRSQWATYARYYAFQAGVLKGVEKLTPAEMTQKAFDLFGVTEPSATTRAAIEACCAKTLSEGDGWVIPAQLVHLMMLSPDVLVA